MARWLRSRAGLLVPAAVGVLVASSAWLPPFASFFGLGGLLIASYSIYLNYADIRRRSPTRRLDIRGALLAVGGVIVAIATAGTMIVGILRSDANTYSQSFRNPPEPLVVIFPQIAAALMGPDIPIAQSPQNDPDPVEGSGGSALGANTVAWRLYTVFFDTNSAELGARASDIIREAADYANRAASIRVKVNGYTDTSESAQGASTISKRRAQAVADELLKNGMARDKIEVHGLGDADPIVPTGPGVSDPQNRRVEMLIH